MKSRTLFFNGTVFKKNITRFAPVWALYGAFLLMLMVVLALDNSSYYFASNIADSTTFFAIINFFYALVCAQLLFGDLYNSRMCNAIHAMPLRREQRFFTNVLSGLAFALIPNTVFAIICLPLTQDLIVVPFLWLAAVTLQYLFFFGTAVLASHCVGNRFAMALVYIIINGFSIIVYWLVETMYAPLMYGVIIREDIFRVLSPLVNMFANGPYVEVEKHGAYAFARWYIVGDWDYLAICSAVGIAATGLALVAYRKRNLECAGDFVSISWLSPVFLVLYTLCGGACCNAFFSLFLGNESYFFLILGFIIGFFTGKMLLERTVRVFRKKVFLGFGVFLLAFSLSFLAVRVDLFGICSWVPKTNRIIGAELYTGSYIHYGYYGDNQLDHVMIDKAQIEDVLMIHRHGIANRYEGSDGKPDVKLTITYLMKDGSQRKREYYINHDTEAGICLKGYMSSPETVLGEIYAGQWVPDHVEIPEAEATLFDNAEIQSLVDAITADALEGNMGQDWNYTEDADYQFWINFVCDLPDNTIRYHSIRVSSDARHVVAWLAERGIHSDNWGDHAAKYEEMPIASDILP